MFTSEEAWDEVQSALKEAEEVKRNHIAEKEHHEMLMRWRNILNVRSHSTSTSTVTASNACSAKMKTFSLSFQESRDQFFQTIGLPRLTPPNAEKWTDFVQKEESGISSSAEEKKVQVSVEKILIHATESTATPYSIVKSPQGVDLRNQTKIPDFGIVSGDVNQRLRTVLRVVIPVEVKPDGVSRDKALNQTLGYVVNKLATLIELSGNWKISVFGFGIAFYGNMQMAVMRVDIQDLNIFVNQVFDIPWWSVEQEPMGVTLLRTLLSCELGGLGSDLSNIVQDIEIHGTKILLIEVLGRGGFSTVYRGVVNAADQQAMQEKVVKIPHFDHQFIPLEFSREVNILTELQSLENEYLVKFDGVSQQPRRAFIFPDLGIPLDQFRDENFPLGSSKRYATRETLALLVREQAINGVVAAHSVGICHTDLRPSNIILFGKWNQIKLQIIDWGLAVHEGDPMPHCPRANSALAFAADEILTAIAERWQEATTSGNLTLALSVSVPYLKSYDIQAVTYVALSVWLGLANLAIPAWESPPQALESRKAIRLRDAELLDFSKPYAFRQVTSLETSSLRDLSQ
jgi:hypothetical protein